MTQDKKQLIEIKALPGYFAAFPTSESRDIDATIVNHLDLINHTTWKELYDSIPQDTATHEYKLLVVARHGQGYHNAAIARYGQDLWMKKWSILNGDEHGEWLDSKLTPLGQEQVSNAGKEVLLPMITDLGFLPHMFFSSPMRRCLETFIGSWNHVFNTYPELIKGQASLQVKIFENIREVFNTHPCNERVEHSVTINEYQDYKTPSGLTIHWEYEDDYPEKDQLWDTEHWETREEIDARIRDGLTSVFYNVNPDDKLISITCHSKVIESILRITEHPAINKLDTAKIVCIVAEIKK
ncbi:probable phosphoglycerate mutase Pmu1p [Monosporozyma unispora]|nr:hypothetical protein C6P44_002176 [Kazachstania unispora]